MAPWPYLHRFSKRVLVEMEEFLTGQQMVSALVLAIGAIIYQYIAGKLTTASLKENAASVVYPFIWVICGFGCYYIIKAAVHLQKEMVTEIDTYKPTVHGYKPRYPSRLPGILTASASILVLALLSYMTFIMAFSSSKPTTPVAYVIPRTPPVAEPPLPRPSYLPIEVIDSRIQFTSSPLWTATRKNTLIAQIRDFDRYLNQYGIIKPPDVLPLFGIIEGTQTSFGFVGPPNPPFDQRKIPVATKRMNAVTIRTSYGNFVFDTLLRVHTSPARFGLVRESWIYAEYFARSSLNEAPPANSKSLEGWVPALWEIRGNRGRDLTDRALLFGLKAPIGDSDDLTKHLRERLQEGVLVVKDTPEMIEVNKILKRHGLLR